MDTLELGHRWDRTNVRIAWRKEEGKKQTTTCKLSYNKEKKFLQEKREKRTRLQVDGRSNYERIRDLIYGGDIGKKKMLDKTSI